ncbi:MAG: acyl-CoA dehydrogenase family protein [Myxococcales bacterium]|nr:acyl-CoA dehydrogenase family protein [Myxococcales bacterium]
MALPTTYSFETEEHADLRRQVRRFAEQQIAPHSHHWDEAEEFPRELYREAAAAGVLGVSYPPELGGAGGDLTHGLVVADALVYHGRSVGTAGSLGSHAISLPLILNLGTTAQKEQHIPPVLRGEKIAALAITEPGAGSDVASLSTSAVRDGDHYIVNGSKIFITSGCRADLVVVAVRTNPDRSLRHLGLTLLVIERNTPGFVASRKLKKTGWWSSDTAELSFSDCRVPVANRLGEEGSGFFAIIQNFAAERLLLAAQCVAVAQLAYDESVAYAKTREAFGKTLSGFQVTRHKLADMATRIVPIRSLVGDLAMRLARGQASMAEVAMAKNAATDMCSFVCDQAVQLHGGMGYMRETLVERLDRDARLFPIGAGTREIMNEIIARAEGY